MINYKYFLKSIGYVVAVHLLTFCMAFLGYERIISDMMWLVLTFAILLFSAPFYFVIKDDAPKPWLYRSVSLGAHVVCSVIVFLWLSLKFPHGPWSILVYVFTELFLWIFLITILVADVVVGMIEKHKKKE